MTSEKIVELSNDRNYGINLPPTENNLRVAPELVKGYKPTPDTGKTNVTISMSKSELAALISKLTKAQQEMEGLWNDIKADFQRITDSWAGSDCAVYMDKVNQMNLVSSFTALKLLADTYTKASNKIDELQAENASIIKTL